MSKKYTIIIEKTPENNSAFLKIIRSVADISLKDAVEINNYLSEHLPCPLVSGIDENKTNIIVEKISSIGGKVKIEVVNIEHPMILYPNANHFYEFNFWGIKKR